MLDTDQLSALDGSFELLATYSDLVADAAELERQYPHSKLVYIDRGLGDPDNKASIGDFETGALRIADVPEWLDAKERQKVNFRTCYSDRNNVQAITEAAGKRSFWRWVATLDGTLQIIGFRALHAPAAVQILPSKKVGTHADFSLVLEPSWHPTRAIYPRTALQRDLNKALSSISDGVSDLHRMAGLI